VLLVSSFFFYLFFFFCCFFFVGAAVYFIGQKKICQRKKKKAKKKREKEKAKSAYNLFLGGGFFWLGEVKKGNPLVPFFSRPPRASFGLCLCLSLTSFLASAPWDAARPADVGCTVVGCFGVRQGLLFATVRSSPSLPSLLSFHPPRLKTRPKVRKKKTKKKKKKRKQILFFFLGGDIFMCKQRVAQKQRMCAIDCSIPCGDLLHRLFHLDSAAPLPASASSLSS
jgi:hypothetical protein